MSSKHKCRPIILIIAALILTVGFSQAGFASSHSGIIESQIETGYNGVGEGDQAISVEATFEAQQRIDGLQIDLSGAPNTFVEYQSIQPSVQGEGVNVNSVGDPGEYVVENLEPGQGVTLEFDAYPGQLDQSEIDGAVFEVTARNPQTLDYTATPTVDMSSSPLLELRSTQDELTSVKSELEQMQLLDTVGIIGVVVSALVGVGGVGAAVVFKRKESEWKAEAYRNAADEVRDFQSRVNFGTSTVEQECRDLINSIENKDETPREPEGPVGSPPQGDGDGSDDEIFD
jgi:hypothetical protein